MSKNLITSWLSKNNLDFLAAQSAVREGILETLQWVLPIKALQSKQFDEGGQYLPYKISTRCFSLKRETLYLFNSQILHRKTFRVSYLEVIGDKLTILFPDCVREKFESKDLRSTFGGATTTFGNVNESILCCRVIPCNLASRRNINQCHEILGSELIIPNPCVWATRMIDQLCRFI